VGAAILAKREPVKKVCGEVSASCLVAGQVTATMQNVLEELLENSIRFRDNERPLRVQIEAAEKGGRLKIAYTDNGCGWDPRLNDKLFRPFERLDARGRFGLGLTIVKALLDVSGGSIEASTTPAGSTFTICTSLR